MNGLPFSSLCYQEQNEWNSIPFILKTEFYSQKNMNTVYSMYSYDGMVPKEHTLRTDALNNCDKQYETKLYACMNYQYDCHS